MATNLKSKGMVNGGELFGGEIVNGQQEQKFVQRPAGYTPPLPPPTTPTVTPPSTERQYASSDQWDAYGGDPNAPPASGDTPTRYTDADTFYASSLVTGEGRQEESMANAQKAIDAINERYSGIEADEARRAEGRVGQTRAMNARAGIMGQDFGVAQKSKTEQFNKEQQQTIEAQRNIEIDNIYTAFDDRANRQIEMDRNLAFKQRDEQLAERDAFQEESRIGFSALASTEATIDSIKADGDWEGWLQQTGYSEEMGKLMFLEASPQSQQIEWQTEVIGNTYLKTGFNPTTGNLEQIKIDLPVDGLGIQVYDNIPYTLFDDNGDGQPDRIEKTTGFEEKLEDKTMTDYQKAQIGLSEKGLEIDIAQVNAGIAQTQANIDKIYNDIATKEQVDPIEEAKNLAQLQILQNQLNRDQTKIDKELIASGQTDIVLKDKIALLDSLISSEAMGKVVGVTGVGRFPLKSRYDADVRDFVGGVQQLIAKETIDTLVNLKERGGTLGALSDQERIMLQNAATKIGSWEMKDKNGMGKGRWNAGEEEFKTELTKIRTLAEKALNRAGDSSGTVEEAWEVETGDTEMDNIFN